MQFNKQKILNSNLHTLQLEIAKESYLYNDIIQERFLDTYNNLTLKVIMGFKWTISNCDNSRYLMKIDEDEVSNTTTVVQMLKHLPKNNTEILMGEVLTRQIPYRNSQCRWYVHIFIN